MAGQGRQIGGLALCFMGVILVCVACGLPMWRETSNVGANVVTAQSVWDGLWLHCVVQATGQMQCKRQPSLTADIQGGRALTLLSIILGLLGFIIVLMGGGVANCSGAPLDQSESAQSSRKKASLLGGILCLLSGILCLIAVSWSAGFTSWFYNDPLVVQTMRREVGSSVYIGWVACVLLILGGFLLCLVCGGKRPASPSYQVYTPYSYISTRTPEPSHPPTYTTGTMASDVYYKRNFRSPPDRTARGRSDPARRMADHVRDHNSLSKAQAGMGPAYGLNPAQGGVVPYVLDPTPIRPQSVDPNNMRGSIVRGSPARPPPAAVSPAPNYYNMAIMDRGDNMPGILF